MDKRLETNISAEFTNSNRNFNALSVRIIKNDSTILT